METKRIDHLLASGALEGKTVVAVGLGSGGFPAIQNLTMCGVSDWVLFDKDEFDSVNLVKHPAMRRDLGRRKTDIAEEWILDRNPNAQVVNHDVDITTDEGEAALSDSIASAHVVVCCTDNLNTRKIVNEHCVEHATPCVWGVIYRTGFAGDAYLYDPGKTGCFECLLSSGEEVSVGRLLEDAKLASTVETPIEEVRYGRVADPKYGLSGLSIDIQFISLLQARLALSVLLEQRHNDDFISALSESSMEATRLENNMLSIPYDYRGPNPPHSVDGRTRWWDTSSGARFGAFPYCMNCRNEIDGLDWYCSKCGHRLVEEGDEERGETSFEVADSPSAGVSRDDWRPMPEPHSSFGINYVMLANRRQIVDELLEEEDGSRTATGNVRVAQHPFSFRTALIKPRKDCPVCSRGD